jgi:hypothetical protein
MFLTFFCPSFLSFLLSSPLSFAAKARVETVLPLDIRRRRLLLNAALSISGGTIRLVQLLCLAKEKGEIGETFALLHRIYGKNGMDGTMTITVAAIGAHSNIKINIVVCLVA